VITAAGEGSAAAIAINADLVEEVVRTAVETFTEAPIPPLGHDVAPRRYFDERALA
jgi:hypothetical protein